ncbi:MAG: hypothetical protein FWE32_08440 [Oscillospiraceae bacterium]|nr:hypothetical protein [Oscillospiraceae bacterium]
MKLTCLDQDDYTKNLPAELSQATTSLMRSIWGVVCEAGQAQPLPDF